MKCTSYFDDSVSCRVVQRYANLEIFKIHIVFVFLLFRNVVSLYPVISDSVTAEIYALVIFIFTRNPYQVLNLMLSIMIWISEKVFQDVKIISGVFLQ